MRLLRDQIIKHLSLAREEQRKGELPVRLAARLVHDFEEMLTESENGLTDLRWHLLSTGSLHRHVISIRCPDQAFYLDGIKGYFERQGIIPLEQQTLVVGLEESDDGQITGITAPNTNGGDNQMLIALSISATLIPDGMSLYSDIKAILKAVCASVSDFPRMKEALTRASEKLKAHDQPTAKLLEWMNQDNYLLFGWQAGRSRLGLFRQLRTLDHVALTLRQELAELPPAAQAGVEWLHLAAAQRFIYSMNNLEVVRISWFEGKTLSSSILLGRFSRYARYTGASNVPLLREKWLGVCRSKLLTQSAYYRREIRTQFDRASKPLLLSLSEKDLLKPFKAIVDLSDPLEISVSLWRPQPGNVRLIAIALSAARFGPNILRRILRQIGSMGLIPINHESYVVDPNRLLFITTSGEPDDPSLEEHLRNVVQQSVIFWKDRAKQALLATFTGADVPRYIKELEGLPPIYAELFDPGQLPEQLKARDQVLADGRTRVHVHGQHAGVELQIFTCEAIPLGRLVETIQAFGLIAQQESVVDFPGSPCVHLNSVRCTLQAPLQADDGLRLRQAIEQVLNGEADHDAANALVLSAGLDAHAVRVLITLRNHLVQILADAAPTPLTRMLNNYPQVSARLYRIFESIHRPAMPLAAQAQTKLEFDKAMDEVQSLTDDRWFRALSDLVQAGLRSNAFICRVGEPLAIKIDPSRLSFAPEPVPFREIFVHGVHVEGVHLRAGPVARGGIRHSDRAADFRTEILELMDTQVVKNGIIVPTGAKGGFVVRDGSGTDFVKNQYAAFIQTLMMLTDNRTASGITPPDGIRVAEEDQNDPYLVVAADKGTAAFSDTANNQAQTAGFWLGDAFASGGRHGYDHKAVGITARGAWVCIRHHFKALGVDSVRDGITVVGIGDMSGDVFGNGMLAGENLKLIGAFNHRHIFLDPDPDPMAAFAERQKLFRMAGGWDQYDQSIISPGGGIFERSAKSIPVSAPMRKALMLDSGSTSGEAVIRALLSAPVDLLYNGGIGTYVRASSESNREVMDPANDSVRISANQLRCRVVGEGGNLGFTQQARIEYAMAGGRINTDAIDNSGGVDMSDHEVNLKILFATKSKFSLSQRNRKLKSLSEAVTEQCLANNLYQSRALSLAEFEAQRFPPRLQRLRNRLLAEGRLNMETDPGMDETQNATLLLRPQLAVLMGHEKNRIKMCLAEDGFAAASCFRDGLLRSYFPKPLLRSWSKNLDEHPLAEDIVHTVAANHLVNQFGLTSIHHLQNLQDVCVADISQSLLIADHILDGETLRTRLWGMVDEHGSVIEVQQRLQEYLLRFAEDLVRLCPGRSLGLDWMDHQRRQFRRFRHEMIQGAVNHENANFLWERLADHGLEASDMAHLGAMPELSMSAVAVHMASAMNTSLHRALRANRACLRLLPFAEVDNLLRSPTWGEDDELHALRCEWLDRMTLLRSQAIRQLLSTRERDFYQSGLRLWQSHKHWPLVQEMRLQLEAETGQRHTHLLLLLARMEAIVHEARALG